MGNCDNCGRNIKAGYGQDSADSIIFCLECHQKASNIRLQAMNHSAAMINFLGGQIDEIFSLPARSRIEVPQPHYSIDRSTQNNISISNSVVGSVNTGIVDSLNTELNKINVNNPAFAEQLVAITRKISSEKDFDDTKKQEALEHLNSLLEQSQKEEERRSKSIIKMNLSRLKSVLGTSSDLITLYPLIQKLFQAV